MSHVLNLPSELTIYGVGELRSRCLEWLAATGGEELVVDGAAVDEVDGAGAQLLIALARSAAADARPLRWAAASPALRKACAAMGLVGTLLPSVDEVTA